MMSAAKKASTSTTLGDYLSDAASLPEAAFLGMYVFFTVTKKARLTRDDIEARFAKLGLDPRFVPNVIRPVDAFKKATGPEVGEFPYRLTSGYDAKVLVRHVTQDKDSITRHLIRERVDQRGRHLDHTHVGDAIFYKQTKGQGPGTERLRFTLHDARLEPGERPLLEQHITSIYANFETYRDFLYDQPLRGMIRDYVLSLNAVSVRPSGGLYFVHRSRWDTVRRLAALVEGLHDGCMLHVTPLVDLPEQRAMLIEAFQQEAEDAVTKLVTDIQARRGAGKITADSLDNFSLQVKQIHARADEHSRILEVSQDKTANALEIAYTLLAGLSQEVYDV